MIRFIRTFIQKLLGARAFIRIVNDPNRLDEVFKLSDNTDQREILDRAVKRFALVPQCAQALQACRRLPDYRLASLAKLPEGTLGKAFAEHMISRNLDPAAIPTLNAKDPAEFVRAHLYETHDIWHVVTGFDTDVAGELGLQGFYMAQIQGPLPPTILAAGMLNTAFLASEESDARMRNIVVGWRMGKRCEPLFGANWDHYWSMSLAEVRRLFGIDPGGAKPDLEAEAAIMTGIGGHEAHEAGMAMIVADRAAKQGKRPSFAAKQPRLGATVS